jgi:hypothetical protein
VGKLHKNYEVNYIEIIKKKLNGNALLCGIGDWNESVGKSDVADYRFLAKTAGPSISISNTYIVFYTKLQKRQTPENRFALYEKRYHRFLTHC